MESIHSDRIMHRCLEIAEIFTQIVRALSDQDPNRGKSALLPLTRTCRAFSECVLDIIWSEQTSLFPLFKCFPEDLVELRRRPEPWWTRSYLESIAFRRQIKESDWTRFNYYAKRIKVLKFKHSRDPVQYIDLTALEAVEAVYPSALLPNLHHLCWSDIGNGLCNARMFLSASVTHFMLSASRSQDDAVIRLLLSVKTQAPSLRYLSLHLRSPASRALSLAFSSLVTKLDDLRQVEAPIIPLTDGALQHLAALPHFTRLNVNMDSAFNAEAFRDGSFSSLRHVLVRCPNFAEMKNFMAAISSCDLESIGVGVPTSLTSAKALSEVVLALSQHPSSGKVEQLALSCDRTPPEPVADQYVVTTTMLRPLLLLRRLKAVRIDTKNVYNVDNDLLYDIAMAWPSLQSLQIISASPSRNCHITLLGLIPLVKHCSGLRNLGLDIDTSSKASTLDAAADLPCNGFITSIYIGFSVVSSPTESVALFLSKVFPQLILIETAWRSNEPVGAAHYAQWKEVQRSLAANNVMKRLTMG